MHVATICIWCDQPMGDEICFNSKDICIDCCIKAGDPCQHTDSHTNGLQDER